MWRPISEAPKNETVLVAEIIVNGNGDLQYETDPIAADWFDEYGWLGSEHDGKVNATHFQPLPPPVVGKPHKYIEVPTPNGFGYVRADEPPEVVRLDAAKCTDEAIEKWVGDNSERIWDMEEKEIFLDLLDWAKVLP
jgi:hypothetical protein